MKKLMYLSLMVGSLLFAAVAINKENSTTNKKVEAKKEGVIFVKNNDNIDIAKKAEKVEAKLEFSEDKKYENYFLLGEYKTKKTIDGKIQVDIDWKKVKKDKTEVTLDEPFSSVLKTTAPIKKDSKFKAKGNLDQLNLVLNEAKEKAEKEALLVNGSQADNKANANQNSNGTTATNKGALNNDLATLTMGSNSDRYKDTNTNANSNPTSGYDSNNFTEPEVTIDDTEATCQNEVSGNTVQFKKLVNNTCMAIGSPVPIYETINGCNPKIDYVTNEVFVGTRKVASLDGNETTVEDCKINYDTPVELKSTYAGCDLVFRKDKKAQVQQEQLFFTWDREDQKIGTCTDSELLYPVDTYLEWNKECNPLIDYNSKTVKFAYREVAQVGGKVEEVTPCKFDNETLHELKSTYDGCEILDDFTNKISIQKERFYYMFENKKEYLGECQESDIAFPHYLTPDTCEFQRLDDNHIVYNKRVAYKDVNGIVHYLTQCKPSEDGSIELTTLKCGYEHDFANNQSYPMSKQIFNDPQTSEVIEVSSCSKDPQNFPHQKDHCSWEYDDENFYSTEWVKKYFVDTNTGEKIYMDISGANEEGCVPNNPIPHVQSSESMVLIQSLGFKKLEKTSDGKYYFDGDQTKVIDLNGGNIPIFKSGSDDISKYITVRGTGVCSNKSWQETNGSNTCFGGIKSTSSQKYDYYAVDSDFGNCGTGWRYRTITYCNYYDYWEEVGEFEIFIKYLRADGTYYNYGSKKVYRIIK